MACACVRLFAAKFVNALVMILLQSAGLSSRSLVSVDWVLRKTQTVTYVTTVLARSRGNLEALRATSYTVTR